MNIIKVWNELHWQLSWWLQCNHRIEIEANPFEIDKTKNKYICACDWLAKKTRVDPTHLWTKVSCDRLQQTFYLRSWPHYPAHLLSVILMFPPRLFFQISLSFIFYSLFSKRDPSSCGHLMDSSVKWKMTFWVGDFKDGQVNEWPPDGPY